MVLAKYVFGVMSIMGLITQTASAGFVIDPFNNTLPSIQLPKSATQTLTTGFDRYLTRNAGGITPSGNNTINFDAGATRVVGFNYDLQGPVDLTDSSSNVLKFNYSATTGLGAGSYTVTYQIMDSFLPTANILSSAVVSGLALAAANYEVLVSSGSFDNIAALQNAQYLRVSVKRSNNVQGGTFSFSSPLLATGVPEPASLFLAGLTGLGVVIARRRRSTEVSSV